MGRYVRREEMSAGPTLVVAPHQDDEMIGCGGWILLARRYSLPLWIVWVTAPDSGRRAEAHRALAGLTLAGTGFLDMPEFGRGGQVQRSEASARLTELVSACRPCHLFVPCLADVHADHRGTHGLVADALASVPSEALPANVIQYEGMTPIGDANWWLDITSVAEEKFQRLGAYVREVRRYRLVDLVGHLNAYRAGTVLRRAVRYAEAYRRMKCKEYMACLPALVS